VSDEPIELMRLGDSKSPLVVSISTFKGARYLDIRRHYFDKVSKSTKPTPKGISLKEDEFIDVIGFLRHDYDSVLKMFTSELAPQELNVRTSRKEGLARSKINNEVVDPSLSFGSWPGPNFFLADISKKSVEIKFNTKNKIVNKISGEELSGIETLEKLINAYALAKKSLTSSTKMPPEATLDFLELAWNNYLK
jgi:hypothetical protein